jgi:hypothetical protein
MNIFKMMLLASIVLVLASCGKKNNTYVHFKIKFDPLQERLNSVGIPVGVTAGKSAQTPVLNGIGINSLEMCFNGNVPLGTGSVLHNTLETQKGDTKYIELTQVKMAKDGEIILSVPMSDIPKGKYEWIRTGVAYENFDVQFNLLNAPSAGNFLDERGAMAVITNTNSFISKLKVFNREENIDGAKKQGFWLFESKLSPGYASYNTIYQGQMAANSITFVNPLAQSSPISKEANIITGRLETPLSILGNEEEDITVVLSFSTNKIFEWEDNINRNGKWDIDLKGVSTTPSIELVSDVGLRGMRAFIQTR